MRVFPKIGVPQNGWFIVENLIKMDDLGVPPFLETSRPPGNFLIFFWCCGWVSLGSHLAICLHLFRASWIGAKVHIWRNGNYHGSKSLNVGFIFEPTKNTTWIDPNPSKESLQKPELHPRGKPLGHWNLTCTRIRTPKRIALAVVALFDALRSVGPIASLGSCWSEGSRQPGSSIDRQEAGSPVLIWWIYVHDIRWYPWYPLIPSNWF